MKWSPLSPYIFPTILALLSSPLVNRAGAATPRPVQPVASAPPGFVVQDVPVNHRPATEIKNILETLVAPGGSALEQPGGKSLTIVDAPANIKDLLDIKELIDAPAFAGMRLGIFAPKKASAEELASAMAELARAYLFPVRRDEAAPVELLPLPRANRILVVARDESAWQRTRPWLERIDAWSGSPRRVFIYPVSQSQATELAAKTTSGQTNSPRVVLDPVTGALVIYGTAAEFQELKKALGGGRESDEFKQRLSALQQKFGAGVKPPP